MAKKKGKYDVVSMYESIIPPHMSDKEPSQKIIKLGKKITDVMEH